MSSLADVLSSEVSTLVEAGFARMDNIFDTSTVQANRNVLAEAEDHTKPYLHLCKTLSVLQEELHKRQCDVTTGRNGLQEAVDTVTDLEESLGKVTKKNGNKRSALEAMETKVNSKNNQLEEMKVQLEDYSSKVNKHLGLDVSLVKSDIANHFLITFSNMMAEGAPCTCELSIDPTNHYKVVKTHPVSLCGDTFVEKAQNLLNETQDLSGFVVALRKKFKAVLPSN